MTDCCRIEISLQGWQLTAFFEMGHDGHQERRSRRPRKVLRLARRDEYLLLCAWLNRPTKNKQLAYVRDDLGVLYEVVLDD